MDTLSQVIVGTFWPRYDGGYCTILEVQEVIEGGLL